MTRPEPGEPGPNAGSNRRSVGRNFRWTLAILIALFVAAVRWLTVAQVHIGAWARGAPTSPGSYVFIVIAIVLLIAPEVSRISFGSFRLEMLRDTRDEVRQVHDSVRQLQLQITETSAKAIAQNVKKQKNVYKTGQAAADLAGGLEKGEEAKPVPLAELMRILKADDGRETSGSTGSTVEG